MEVFWRWSKPKKRFCEQLTGNTDKKCASDSGEMTQDEGRERWGMTWNKGPRPKQGTLWVMGGIINLRHQGAISLLILTSSVRHAVSLTKAIAAFCTYTLFLSENILNFKINLSFGVQ